MSGPSSLRILVSIDEEYAAMVDAVRLEELAAWVLSEEGVEAAELGVVVTSDETVRDLNRQYAGDDHATDVLSFSLEEGEEFVAPPDGERPLGEVIISYPTAERQAQEQGQPVAAEIDHLLTHGVLHLLGYDHVEPEEERRMHAREMKLLGRG